MTLNYAIENKIILFETYEEMLGCIEYVDEKYSNLCWGNGDGFMSIFMLGYLKDRFKEKLNDEKFLCIDFQRGLQNFSLLNLDSMVMFSELFFTQIKIVVI